MRISIRVRLTINSNHLVVELSTEFRVSKMHTQTYIVKVNYEMTLLKLNSGKLQATPCVLHLQQNHKWKHSGFVRKFALRGVNTHACGVVSNKQNTQHSQSLFTYSVVECSIAGCLYLRSFQLMHAACSFVTVISN